MRVRAVDRGEDLRAFVDLPFRLHRDDPVWVPPLRAEVRARLSRRRNPFFDHGDAAYFLAEQDGRVVGRIAAIANRRHDAAYGDGAGFFGFFECTRDSGAARALFGAASSWVAERGYSTLRGPTSFSTNDECGLLIDGFDTPPTVMMPHNPPYYVELVESCGFGKRKDLLAFEGGSGSIPQRATHAIERLRRRSGAELRGLNTREFPAEVTRIKEMYNAAWERNWGFVSMSDREIDHMARQFKPVYVPQLVPFVEMAGRIVGFGLAIPDLNEVLRSNRQGRLFPAVLRLLWAVRRRKLRRLRILLLGVLPEFRGRGIDALIWHRIWENALALGFRWGEAGWILEDNAPMCNAAERMGFRRYKTYRLYERGV